jgi:patatin-like phospholipase/acyl hydrolase
VNAPLRIVALDGGGMRGIFTASYLAALEQSIGTRMIDVADLLVGTSTGGIIALGLASGRSADEMLAFYKTRGREIFSRPRRLPRRLIQPKYDRGTLDAALREEFGDAVMNDLQKHVCITSHELVAGTTRVFKDDHAPGLYWGGDQLVWKVAAATAAAPTYFAPMQVGAEDSHVDGGVWANNPSLVGITEAVRYFNRRLNDIRLLSIGTTSRVLRVRSHRDAARLGLIGWARQVTDLLQGTVSMSAHRQAELLLPDGHYLRIDDELAEAIRLDDVAASIPLEERGAAKARTTLPRVKELLAI